jgi:chemotaxis protein histidine kinase CheA
MPFTPQQRLTIKNLYEEVAVIRRRLGRLAHEVDSRDLDAAMQHLANAMKSLDKADHEPT